MYSIKNGVFEVVPTGITYKYIMKPAKELAINEIVIINGERVTIRDIREGSTFDRIFDKEMNIRYLCAKGLCECWTWYNVPFCVEVSNG